MSRHISDFLYSSISIYLYAFGAHIPFWIYSLLSQSTTCITPLVSSLIVKNKQTPPQIITTIPSLVCTLSTDVCSICFFSCLSVLVCVTCRGTNVSSIQCTWTRENLSDDQLVRVRLSFSFLFWMPQNMNLAKSVFCFFPPFLFVFCIALVCFRKTKFLLNTLVRKNIF